MTSVVVTPAGVPNFDLTPREDLVAGRTQMESYWVRLERPAPLELRMRLEVGQEEGGVWAHIPELDISAEAGDLDHAFRAVVLAARDWLSYLRDEQVELAPALNEQAKYVALLDAPEFSWFRDISFVD